MRKVGHQYFFNNIKIKIKWLFTCKVHDRFHWPQLHRVLRGCQALPRERGVGGRGERIHNPSSSSLRGEDEWVGSINVTVCVLVRRGAKERCMRSAIIYWLWISAKVNNCTKPTEHINITHSQCYTTLCPPTIISTIQRYVSAWVGYHFSSYVCCNN